MKNFYSHNLGFSSLARVFVPGKPFRPSLMFMGKARDVLQTAAPERCFALVGSGLPNKHYTWLEKLATDNSSSLIRKFVTYGRKKFDNIGPWLN